MQLKERVLFTYMLQRPHYIQNIPFSLIIIHFVFLFLKNAAKGTFVFDVNATDDDIEENGQVQYAIMHGAEGRFSINASSGFIETTGDLDRESNDFYTVTFRTLSPPCFLMRENGLSSAIVHYLI